MTKRGEEIQRQVLESLRQSSTPLSAYDLLDHLRDSHPKIAPPTVYRALAALTSRGSIHRLESLNAYMACQCGSHPQESILSICGDCGSVGEQASPDVLEILSGLAQASGFTPDRHVIEVHGVCGICTCGEGAA